MRYKLKTLKRYRKRFRLGVLRRGWHRHPLALPLGIFFGLAAVGAVLLIATPARKPVTFSNNSFIVIVSHDGERQTVPTEQKTVGDLLKKLDIRLSPGDRVEPAQSTPILQDNFLVNVYRAVPVVVTDGTQEVRVLSAATTPRAIATAAGLHVYPEDVVTAAAPASILDGDGISKRITVRQSVPVNLNLYGTPITVRTQAKTVGEFVKEKKIRLTDGAVVAPAENTPLTPGTQVFVLKKGVLIASQQESVPAPVQNVDDANLTLGTRAVRQQGSPGTQVVTYQIQIDAATGKEVSRTAIQTVVTQSPVPQIVAIGKNVAVPKDKVEIMRAAGIAESDYGYVDFIVSHEGGWGGVTKYNSSGSGAYGICQALPGSKMASAGADWATNPVTQLKWCSGYAVGRYGSWYGAYIFWQNNRYW